MSAFPVVFGTPKQFDAVAKKNGVVVSFATTPTWTSTDPTIVPLTTVTGDGLHITCPATKLGSTTLVCSDGDVSSDPFDVICVPVEDEIDIVPHA